MNQYSLCQMYITGLTGLIYLYLSVILTKYTTLTYLNPSNNVSPFFYVIQFI